ncbi:MAG: cysteine desulfurase, partial [candidate division Zixibacteria bacterium]|nr:cysteine desulfurase [candidate division Zixibacteria bacterium]
MKQIYLDNNATTPVDERVLDVMLPYLKGMYGNPSSVHFSGREAKAAMENAREQVAKFINADPSEIYFTSGGTESDNIAIKGTALQKKDKKNHIIVSSIEHHAILESAHYLEKDGFKVDYLGVDKDGFISPDELKEKITDKTSVVSIMQANNEVGTIQDIPSLSAIAKEAGAIFHTDAVQAAGKEVIDVDQLGADMLSISGHKVYGPKGIGIIYIRKGKRITPLFHGGHHEKKRRAGTENIPGIVGIGAALELAESLRETEHKRLAEL